MVIIVVIIISFVVFFTPGVGSGGNPDEFSIEINGQTYSRDEVQSAANEVRLFYFLRNQQPPSNEVYNQLALQRLLVKRLTAQYGINVGNESVVEWIRERIMGGTGSFGGMTYDQYVASVLKTGGFTAKLFEEFVRTEVGSEILRTTVGSVGALVTPAEARAAFIRDNEKMPVEVAYVANSNYLGRVNMNLDDVTQFYSNRVAAYRSPERIQVSYVRLATSNYVAEAEQSLSDDGGLDVLVETEYQSRSNLFVGIEIEAAKNQIRQEIIDSEAFKIAQRKAYDFVNSYYELEPKTTAVLSEAAQKIGLSVEQAPPFGRSESPTSTRH
jgi:peptidyl-prolyl cis-trans isomerase D